MEKKSRYELIKTIESQREQLVRFETRLRDVVHAYKNLIKEKEALEASIKVLTVAGVQNNCKQADKTNKKLVTESSDDSDKTTDGQSQEHDKSSLQETAKSQSCVVDHPLSVKEESDQDKPQNDKREEELQKAREDMATLTASFATVMEQKSKMEASYQADKKKMMQEHEAKVMEYSEENTKKEQRIEELELQVQELKLRTRQEQQEREEEQNNHVLMLRELQLLLANERAAKEDLEQQLEDAREAAALKTLPDSKVEEYEQCIAELRTELEKVRERLKKAEEKAARPSPALCLLQEEMSEMKKEHKEAVLREQRRVMETEEKLKVTTSVEEHRVGDLEAKLSELSEVVGGYEKLRLQDQLAIQKLKERLQQLDVENTALSLQRSSGQVFPNNDLENEDNKGESLQEQVNKLKGLLRIAIDKSERPLERELEELSKSELESILSSDPTHKACQQELKQLKDEFERYKLKTQALHRNRSAKELSVQLENVEKLKTKVSELEKHKAELREYSERREKDQDEVINNLREDMKLRQQTHKQEMEDWKLIYHQKLNELEKQVLHQRERTLSLLAEKDSEIESLKSRSPSSSPSRPDAGSVTAFSYQRKFVDLQSVNSGGQAAPDPFQSTDAEAAVCQLLARNSGVSSSESSLVHYAQQQARREAESCSLRRQKYELEASMRDSEEREGKLLEQSRLLKDEIRKLERDRSRESANLEYLKNVILEFMMSHNPSVKQQTITAIATILQFSPKEVSKVRKMHSGAWWGSST